MRELDTYLQSRSLDGVDNDERAHACRPFRYLSGASPPRPHPAPRAVGEEAGPSLQWRVDSAKKKKVSTTAAGEVTSAGRTEVRDGGRAG
jgi:hypothetical protein